MPVDVRDQAAYDRLQQKLVPLWSSLTQLNNEPQTIVVVPSAKIDFELPASVLQAYEERYLCLLLLLRQPRARMIYVTGQPIHPDVIDYYLDIMPGVLSSHARRRLDLLSPMEATFRPLTDKILERPRLIERIKSLIGDPDRAHLVPFMATWADRELAMRLGIPMYGPDPKDAALGTKSQSRAIFEEVGINHPAGRRSLKSKDDLVSAIASLRAATPGIGAVVAKLDEGVSGFGNAVIDVEGLPPPGDAAELPAIRDRLAVLPIAFPGVSPADFFVMLEKGGGVVEEMIAADEIRSPSVQMRVTPLGELELLSTHDQVLGGESGQVFLGSKFPADPGYASMISADALKVGRRLAELGVIGRFAIDFVVARSGSDPWVPYAIEVNLRKGGTTHPFLTLQFLTDGTYDAASGLFTAPTGKHKFYVASDHFDAACLRRLLPSDVLDIALMEGLHFDQARQVGTVFHMLSALPTTGQIGVTCVGDSPEEAQERFDRLETALTAAAEGTLPA